MKSICHKIKHATNINEQLELLKSRGMIICDEQKAKEVLMDIGYYRMGFYFFPFERSYPKLKNRNHIYSPGAEFSHAVALYYYDFDLRCILLRYINRIEVAFRAHIIYELSNKYKNDPVWFINPNIVSQQFIQNFDKEIYNEKFRNNAIIFRHHNKYPNDKYAPAWKTIELMTLGNVVNLYKSLKKIDDKRIICKCFGINQSIIMENYMETIRVIRNICAHGFVLHDIILFHVIKNSPSGSFNYIEANTLSAILDLILYLIGTISLNRRDDFFTEIKAASTKAITNCHAIQPIIEKNVKKFLNNGCTNKN